MLLHLLTGHHRTRWWPPHFLVPAFDHRRQFAAVDRRTAQQWIPPVRLGMVARRLAAESSPYALGLHVASVQDALVADLALVALPQNMVLLETARVVVPGVLGYPETPGETPAAFGAQAITTLCF